MIKEEQPLLEIIVNKEPIKIVETLQYSDVRQFFAIGENGHLYYKQEAGHYDLLKKDFRNDTHRPELREVKKYDQM